MSGPELVRELVVVASAVVQQSGFAVEALAGEIVGGGHAAQAVARGAEGGEQLHRQYAARAGKGNGAAAQVIAEQVREGGAGTQGKTLSGGAVVLGDGRAAAADDGFGEAIEGDGVLDATALNNSNVSRM